LAVDSLAPSIPVAGRSGVNNKRENINEGAFQK
jgi:hypothetical protein